jgi:UPF0755 protein
MSIEKTIKIYLFLLFVILLAALARTITPPPNFPKDTIVSVDQGSSLEAVSQKLKREGIIRSPFWFRVSAIAMGGERDMKAGHYYFDKRESPFAVAWRILHAKYNVETVRITIPEGFTARKITALFDDRFPFFDSEAFLKAAPEGYLFPDTYFVPVTATASSTIKLMRDNFIRKIFPLMPEIEESGKSLERNRFRHSLAKDRDKDASPGRCSLCIRQW